MDRVIVTGPEVVHWMEERLATGLGNATAMGVRSGERLLGGVAFNSLNGACVELHGASVTHRWLTKGFVWLVFWYAFNQLGVQRITTAHGEQNTRASRLVKHLGFSLETTLERAHPDGRLLIYRMFIEDCRFLQWREYRRAA